MYVRLFFFFYVILEQAVKHKGKLAAVILFGTVNIAVCYTINQRWP
uniref:Uncharacterized protein n=1 Tax=Anguilla anguilla TaxID=7936 RepID=A0A0E9TAL9_ANGAN